MVAEDPQADAPLGRVNETAVANIVREWKGQEDLVAYAARGFMCQIGKATDIDRKEVNANTKVLQPVVQHLGHLAPPSLPVLPPRSSARNRGPACGV